MSFRAPLRNPEDGIPLLFFGGIRAFVRLSPIITPFIHGFWAHLVLPDGTPSTATAQAQRCFEQALEMSETPNPVPPLSLCHLCGHFYRIHVWYIYLHEWLIFMVKVGKL